MFGNSDSTGDGLIFGIAIFCTVFSIMATILTGVLLPGAGPNYSYDEIQAERESVMYFTGDTITNSTPWKLTQVYTPYELGSEYTTDPDGFLFGSSVTNYSQLGKTSDIRLDVGQKSNVTLSQGIRTTTVKESSLKWYYNPQNPVGWFLGPVAVGWANITGNPQELITTETYDVDYQTWAFQGYRYRFSPMLPFAYVEGESTRASSVDGALSIVWYAYPNVEGGEGLSGGLVIYDKDQVIISNYSMADIIAGYNVNSAKSSRYDFDFQGTRLYLNIRFDQDVLIDGIPLEEAFSQGKWTMAITSASAGNFLDLKNSTSFTDSLGGIVDTFIDIFTFNLPQVDNALYTMLLWILCVFPAELASMLFLFRVFGLAGVGAGVVGNILAYAFMGG